MNPQRRAALIHAFGVGGQKVCIVIRKTSDVLHNALMNSFRLLYNGGGTNESLAHRATMAKIRKLSYDDWLQLSNLMENVPDPDTTYTATGWHYELMNFLRTVGYRPAGRYEAYRLAVKLLEAGPHEK